IWVAVADVSLALTLNRMSGQSRTVLMSTVAVALIRSWPSDLSRTRPFELTASTKCFRPMKTVGAPARANIPPKYPPTAPAPTTAIRGHSRVWLLPIGITCINKVFSSDENSRRASAGKHSAEIPTHRAGAYDCNPRPFSSLAHSLSLGGTTFFRSYVEYDV